MKLITLSRLVIAAFATMFIFGCGGGGGGGGAGNPPPGGGGGARPVAAFTIGAVSGTVPLTVTFTDTSSNAPTSWAWNFGDGTTSISQNPTHVYTAVGTYRVTMTAANSVGASVALATATITVSNQPVDARPIAAFTSSVISGTFPLSVSFSDNSSNAPTSWSWNFGDGTTSTSQNPTHVYTAAGTYTVTMSATNAVGTSLAPATTTITVSSPPVDARPVAAFTSSVISGTAPLSVTFTDSSSNSPTSWAWNFGDGTTSTSQNPTHVFTAAGIYTVTMSATNAVGTSLAPATATITVSSPPNVTTLAVINVALQGTLNVGQEIGSVQFNLSIPPGVTARTNPAPAPAGETASSVVVASGVAATGSTTIGNYTAPVGTTPGNLTVLLQNPSGFLTGSFVTITFDYTGTAPVLGDFVLSNVSIFDAGNGVINGFSSSRTLQLQ